MKKLLLGLVAAGFMVGSAGVVWCAPEEGLSKEERKEEKRREREAKKHQEELRKEEKRKECEARKEEKRREAEAKKHEKELRKEQERKECEARKEEKRREHEARKEEKRREREERDQECKHNKSKEGKCVAKEERNAQLKAKEQASKEKHERRRLERKAKYQQHQERSRARYEQRKVAHKQYLENEHAKHHAKDEKVHAFRANREVLIDKWAHSHKAAVDHARGEGKYAFLYKSPSWPTYALFFEGGKTFFNIGLTYDYACDCYNSTRGGSKSNITQLAFGEQPITWDSILLAQKLALAGQVYGTPGNSLLSVNSQVLTSGTPILNESVLLNPPNLLLVDTSDPLKFRGKEDKYSIDFELSRYILSNNIAVGVQLPVVYNKHKLHVVTPLETDESEHTFFDGDLIDTAAHTMLNKVLLAKGITELGGSAMGLGDVSAFVNAQIDSAAFDKLVVGFRGQFATGKKATAKKLWAPELGNGGWTEFSLFGSSLVSYAKYLNLHLMLEAGFSLPAHLDRRVPRMVTFDDLVGNNTVNGYLTQQGQPTIAFGDRIVTIAGQAVSSYDVSTIKGFADHTVRAKITKGIEFKIRFGNMFERFISTKGFLDLFYDFRGKLKDSVSGIDKTMYLADSLRWNTQELEHRIGFEYSYQFDLRARLRLGMRYTFAGMNVPKTFELNGAMNYAF